MVSIEPVVDDGGDEHCYGLGLLQPEGLPVAWICTGHRDEPCRTARYVVAHEGDHFIDRGGACVVVRAGKVWPCDHASGLGDFVTKWPDEDAPVAPLMAPDE